MKTRLGALVVLFWVRQTIQLLGAEELRFVHHFIDRTLPLAENGVGNYGLTALTDIDRDGDLDFVTGGRPSKTPRLYWYEFRSPNSWIRHDVGTNYLSDVGLAALDVDRDGWIDLVCSGVWFRNPGKPRQQEFERFDFDPTATGAHDILAADIDGNGRPDIVMMGDERTGLNSLCWYSIPQDPRQKWPRHIIGPPVHGAIAPGGVLDIDGDGDLDVLRADTWYENIDGRGLDWKPHRNIAMGRRGPYGVCVRTAVADMDGDGHLEVVMADCDIEGSTVAVLQNQDRKGKQWHKTLLPQSLIYGSLHSLAVADFTGDGQPDILVNEQEELLPENRQNPRWVLWENKGNKQYVEHVILDAKLGGHELQTGDVDGDGDLDACSKPWGTRKWNALQGAMHVDLLENTLKQNRQPSPPAL
ncbi:MAG: VCBS repeat-containing protein [Verrucomicrobiae bacterium]|nr:VCBS repeat-containing protein [Verrucomicrobiae bacterium]